MTQQVPSDKLPQIAHEFLKTPTPNVVIATVDKDGFPLTVPFDLIYAPNPKTLYVLH